MSQSKKPTRESTRFSTDLNDLLPCPFCGKIPVVNKRENGTWEVRCINENCGVVVMTDEKISEKLAIKTWNYRAR